MSTTNDQVIAITARRRPMFRPALVKATPPASPEPVRRGSYADPRLQFPERDATPTPPAPDPALVLRWLEHIMNDPYEMIAVLRASQPGTFGTAALHAATAMAETGQVPPCRP